MLQRGLGQGFWTTGAGLLVSRLNSSFWGKAQPLWYKLLSLEAFLPPLGLKQLQSVRLSSSSGLRLTFSSIESGFWSNEELLNGPYLRLQPINSYGAQHLLRDGRDQIAFHLLPPCGSRASRGQSRPVWGTAIPFLPSALLTLVCRSLISIGGAGPLSRQRMGDCTQGRTVVSWPRILSISCDSEWLLWDTGPQITKPVLQSPATCICTVTGNRCCRHHPSSLLQA